MTTDHVETLRLLMPQWQGGGNNPLYPLGARLLAWLAPESEAPLVEVPIAPYGGGDLPVEGGVTDRGVLLEQIRAARRIIEAHRPERLIVFGGDCSVAQAPLSYLNERYDGELGVLWIDRHPDVKTPAEAVNAHAMVLGHLLGGGDAEFRREVGRFLKPEKVMLAGLGDVTAKEEEMIAGLGLVERAGAGELARDSRPVLQWLSDRGIRHLAVHLDLDALDPALFRSLLGGNPEPDPGVAMRTGTMTFPQLTRLLLDVSEQAELVGLVLAEHIPWDAFNLQKMLSQLPILNRN